MFYAHTNWRMFWGIQSCGLLQNKMSPTPICRKNVTVTQKLTAVTWPCWSIQTFQPILERTSRLRISFSPEHHFPFWRWNSKRLDSRDIGRKQKQRLGEYRKAGKKGGKGTPKRDRKRNPTTTKQPNDHLGLGIAMQQRDSRKSPC